MDFLFSLLDVAKTGQFYLGSMLMASGAFLVSDSNFPLIENNFHLENKANLNTIK